jgi:hypothetical protein
MKPYLKIDVGICHKLNSVKSRQVFDIKLFLLKQVKQRIAKCYKQIK